MSDPTDITKRIDARVERQDERYRLPAADIYETHNNVTLVADMPGVGKGDVAISLEKNILSIVAQAAKDNPDNGEIILDEYGPLPYRRVFTLSPNLSADGIAATMRNGVLRLIIPKVEEARVKTIPIKTG